MGDDVTLACLNAWSELNTQGCLRFLRDPYCTILAGIVLVNDSRAEVECISLGAGSKCLAQSQLRNLAGHACHDSHAEVMARRSAISWLLLEIMKLQDDPSYKSTWLGKIDNPPKSTSQYRLSEGTEVIMYVSTLPCASTT